MNDVLDYAIAKFMKHEDGDPILPKVPFKSYEELKVTSDRWHTELSESEFKDEDRVYYESLLPDSDISSVSIDLSVVRSRKELYLAGVEYKNCIYSRHEDIGCGRSMVLRGTIKESQKKFIAEVRKNSFNEIVVYDIRGILNQKLDDQSTRRIDSHIRRKVNDFPKIVEPPRPPLSQ